ncbi:hypothetical protein MKX01_017593 [Papaver californicum]|nr:hypothetical protein MKX01_017593 [Papaver californicum]
MEVIKDDQAKQAKIWKLIYGFAQPLVLKCAVKLDIAGTIHNHGQPMTLTELASQLPAQPINLDRLYRVIRYLVHVKVFTKENDEEGEIRYGLSPSAKYLIKGWERSMIPLILALYDKDLCLIWNHLKEGLIGICTPFEKALGASIWVYMAEQPHKNQFFNEFMACERLTTIIDVGGGTGATARAISKTFPHVKCAVFDLPHVIAACPPDPDIIFVDGDMFKYLPSADAIIMKSILHDWGDNECVQILKLCKEAVPRDKGKVIIIDVVLNSNSGQTYSRLKLRADLGMMAATGGKERTKEEWEEIIHAAGFSSYKLMHMSTIQSVKKGLSLKYCNNR